MKTNNNLMFSLLLLISGAQADATVQARVTYHSTLYYVRCECPMDEDPYPTILNERGFCSKFNNEGARGALLCDDADLQCDNLLHCWGSHLADASWGIETFAAASTAGSGMSCTATGAAEQACEISETYGLTVAIGPIQQIQALCDQPDVNCAANTKVYSDGELLADAVAVETLPPSSAPIGLPRCHDTEPSGGMDRAQVSKSGNKCATLLHSADFRTTRGNLITYAVEVEDTNDCTATFQQAVDGATLNSGQCKSYYIRNGVACLSGCDDPYDCYVSESLQSLDYPSCALAAGVDERANDIQSDHDGALETSSKGTHVTSIASLIVTALVFVGGL